MKLNTQTLSIEFESVEEFEKGVRSIYSGNWSNQACIGYILKAMLDANLKSKTQKNIISAIYQQKDEMTVSEAESYARSLGL